MPLFMNNMIVQVENRKKIDSREATRISSEFGKSAGYKVNTSKQKAFI